ncbi:MAG: imidazole glycerol phosphate synthase subunit HisH [Enterococcus sp.]
MIAIVDYGVGNLFSLGSSLKRLDIDYVITNELAVLQKADQILLPGVGAFGDAKQKLDDTGLTQPLIDLAKAGKPLLGICLGMQLLFESSDEFGHHKGLGLIKGQVSSLSAALKEIGSDLKVPHIGWNELEIADQASPLLKDTTAEESFYYVHSFYATNCESELVGYSEYGVHVPGIVQNGNVFGTQFHPEKSGQAGLKLLKAFSEVTNENLSSN